MGKEGRSHRDECWARRHPVLMQASEAPYYNIVESSAVANELNGCGLAPNEML
jgi:hypothetical protein